MKKKDGSTMLWRPNQLQASSLRATNMASFFPSLILEGTDHLNLAPWFLKIHVSSHGIFSKLINLSKSDPRFGLPRPCLPRPCLPRLPNLIFPDFGFPDLVFPDLVFPDLVFSEPFLTHIKPSPEVWRLRAYRPEKTLGAAKPLWFLKHPLNLTKGTVQRII